MPAGSDLRETFPSRSFLLVGAGSFMLGGAAWYPSGWGVKLASAGIGVLLGILAAAALRRRPALLRPGSAKKSDFWAWNALAVASGVVLAANVPHVGPWFLGIAAGLFFGALLRRRVAAPAPLFRRWSEIRGGARRGGDP